MSRKRITLALCLLGLWLLPGCNGGGYTDAHRRAMMEACVRENRPNLPPEVDQDVRHRVEDYCACRYEALMEKYPSPEDLEQATIEQVLQATESRCRNKLEAIRAAVLRAAPRIRDTTAYYRPDAR